MMMVGDVYLNIRDHPVYVYMHSTAIKFIRDDKTSLSFKFWLHSLAV